jgi:hypothetical protein
LYVPHNKIFINYKSILKKKGIKRKKKERKKDRGVEVVRAIEGWPPHQMGGGDPSLVNGQPVLFNEGS